jgi:Raf kinase inhibitor-like YbhB/YbcL family protein
MLFKNTFMFIAAAVAALDAHAQTFLLTSPDFSSDQMLDSKFTFSGMGCKGANVSPALTWANPPAGARSFALMVHDPDAPTGGAGIWHWVLVNIPATVNEIAQGAGTNDGASLPAGSKQVRNDYEMTGWGGPCPPKGAKPHRYNFTLYALGVEKLEFPAEATASHVGFLINRNAIGKAQVTATYGRDN